MHFNVELTNVAQGQGIFALEICCNLKLCVLNIALHAFLSNDKLCPRPKSVTIMMMDVI